MEISLKYFLIKLQLLVPILLTFLFIGGGDTEDITGEKAKNEIESKVRILIGVVIAVHYTYKTIRYDAIDTEVKRLSKEVESLRDEVDKLK